ncbi:MAG TPA: hypothetical protein PLA94_03385, partial [Myxococcota bacterium]|nr:hypothetical protein [Myxococcota bacterium]
VPTGGLLAVATGQAIRSLIRLASQPQNLVSETSSQGRKLILIIEEITQILRETEKKPICLLVDGLEKMNGASAERLAAVFQYTRLLADLPIASVYAAPPCTLTVTNSVESVGWKAQPVWGFGEQGVPSLVDVLQRRFRAAGMDPNQTVDVKLLEEIAQQSGGMPRHAVEICFYAAEHARRRDADTMEPADVKAAIDQRGQELGRGLTEEDIRILKVVLEKGSLPASDDAARLFTDGRILATRPGGSARDRIQRFRVHPLLVDSLRDDPDISGT